MTDADLRFGSRLHTMRQAAGYTQADVADLMQAAGFSTVHRSTIGKMENGDRPVTIGEASGLAAALGVSLEQILSEPSARRDYGLALAEMAAKRRQIAELEETRGETEISLAAAKARLEELERSL